MHSTPQKEFEALGGDIDHIHPCRTWAIDEKTKKLVLRHPSQKIIDGKSAKEIFDIQKKNCLSGIDSLSGVDYKKVTYKFLDYQTGA